MIDKRMDCQKKKKNNYNKINKNIFFTQTRVLRMHIRFLFLLYCPLIKLHETWSEELHNLHFIY